MLRFDSIVSKLSKEQIQVQSSALRDKLHERKPKMVEIFKDIQLWYTAHVKPQKNDQDIGEFANFMTEYLQQVESLLHLVSSCCAGD